MTTHQVHINGLTEYEWSRPDCYIGPNYDDYFVIYGRNRDSSILENCNYEGILEDLERELMFSGSPLDDEHPLVFDVRDSHWAVGWIEYILVSRHAPDRVLHRAYELLGALADYPILCEETYSKRQWDAVLDYWERASLRERAEWCQDAGESIFAARRDTLTEKLHDALFQHEMFY